MYVHVSDQAIVRAKDIIAIIDIASAELCTDFLQANERSVVHSRRQNAKSMVITEQTIYFSSYSSANIKKKVLVGSVGKSR
ncbi:extracellular matrix regulator RemB [Bacillus fonticola]|uniref:extracellular matrix regulator RemB n=1 Tax=Bacillus fonticola TaxID=2728853 RepID=UPI00147323E2|nr:extracellular matrix/biofilm biosynthesis regulator RemA family protein [Bacillus fonticola]